MRQEADAAFLLDERDILLPGLLRRLVRARVGGRQLGERGLERRDVGADADNAAIPHPALGDQEPAAIRQKPLDRAGALPVPDGNILHEILDIAGRLRILAESGTSADDVLEMRSSGHEGCAEGIKLTIALVAGHQPVVLVPHHEAVGHRLDRIIEDRRGSRPLGIGPFALVDGQQDRPGKGGEEQHGDDRAGHCPVAILAPVREDLPALHAEHDPEIAVE